MTAITAALYLRYSSEMQGDGRTIETQDTECRKWCAEHGRTVVEVYKDEAKSASSTDRPEFQRMLVDVRAKKFTEIVFYDLTRLSRNVEDVALLEQIARSGVRLVSTRENLTRDSSGLLIRDMNLVIGSHYLRQLSERTTAGKRTRATGAMPRSNATTPPFGYTRAGGEDVPDGNRAIALQIFTRYSTAMHSDNDIAKWLNDQGAKTTGNWGNRPFSKDTIRMMIMNKFYAGYVAYRGMSEEYTAPDSNRHKRRPRAATTWTKGSHQPIISEELFDKCQQVRAQSSRYAGRKPSHNRVYLLQGLATCLRCNRRMNCHATSTHEQPSYICRSHERGIACASVHVYVQEQYITAQIDAMIKRLVLPDEIIDRAIELSQSDDTQARQNKRRETLRESTRRVNVMYKSLGITDAEYRAAMGQIRAELDALQPVKPAEVQQAAQVITGLADAWRDMDATERHAVLAVMLQSVTLDIDRRKITRWIAKREFAALFAVVH